MHKLPQGNFHRRETVRKGHYRLIELELVMLNRSEGGVPDAAHSYQEVDRMPTFGILSISDARAKSATGKRRRCCRNTSGTSSA